jgi:L-ascorbate metabolism protein UlaG (beta-lactamase superfamily)
MGATLTYHGQSTFLVETGGGRTIYIDPWLQANPVCPEELKSPRKADLICLTHGHGDHTGDIMAVFNENPCPVAGHMDLVRALGRAHEALKDHLTPVGKGGTVDLGGIQLTMTHAIHGSSYGPDGVYAGEPCGLILTFEDGKRIYHAGDTCLFSDMKLIGELWEPDLCFLPIGDRATMGPAHAAIAVSYLNAKRVVPVHHSSLPFLTGKPEDFAAEVAKRSPDTEVIILKPGETVSV